MVGTSSGLSPFIKIMDGLQLFRRVASNFLHEDTISSLEEWRELMTTLCDAKIIRPGDMKSID